MLKQHIVSLTKIAYGELSLPSGRYADTLDDEVDAIAVRCDGGKHPVLGGAEVLDARRGEKVSFGGEGFPGPVRLFAGLSAADVQASDAREIEAVLGRGARDCVCGRRTGDALPRHV